MRPLTIAVTGLNATDNPAPGVGVIRSIRAGADRECRIVGLSYDPLDSGNYLQDVADQVFLMPYPSEGAKALFERLSHIQQHCPIDVLIPSLDAELPLYIKLRRQLAEIGISMFIPDEEQFKLRAKDKLGDLHDKFDISVPKSLALNNPEAIRTIDQEISFPVMVKGQFYDAFRAHSPLEVEAHFHRLRAKWGGPIIIQEFVCGEEFDVLALGDGLGGLIGAVPMRKMQLTDKGKAWGGVTIQDAKLMNFVEHCMRKLQWRGPCELEIMKTDDGKFFLIELNPRFPAWVYLAVGAKRNLPWQTVCLALGESVTPLGPPSPGVMFLRHSRDQICTLKDFSTLVTVGELNRLEASL